MEIKLIEVALALVVMYLVLALLATQLSELWAGAFSSRQRNLELMVEEAFDGNQALATNFFHYGPIQALAKNNSMGGLLKGRRRPSSIPADLFATAYLAVLNGGTPPRAQFRAPSEFVNSLKAQPPTKQVLVAHVAGTEADWDVFEARIARWYADIGDRGEGWYKRRNALWMIVTAILLSVLVNADSAFVAKRLFEDDELRVSVANIGERIVAEELRAQGQAPASAPPLPAASEFDRAGKAVAELGTALDRINAAINGDPKVAGFGYDFQNLAERCSPFYDAAVATTTGSDKGKSKAKDEASAAKPVPAKEWFATNSDAWKLLLPSVQGLLQGARVEASLQVNQCSASVPSGICASDRSRNQTAEPMESRQRIGQFRLALACVSAISVWVGAAQASAPNNKGKPALKEAGDALERAQRLLYDLVSSAAIQGSLIKRFKADAEGFVACANEAGSSRSAFDQCLRATQGRRIPLGWPPQGDQFCVLKAYPAGSAPDGGDKGWMAGTACPSYIGNPVLGLPAFDSRFSGLKAVAAGLGMVLTAVLVSLGAPFWFGALSKLANLRAAGRVRDADTSEAAAKPTDKPLPSAAAAKPDDGSAAPFDDSRNEFERGLRPQDITRLQNALGVAPTARLDLITRNAIGARLGGDEALGSVSYETIVGRSASSVTPVEVSGGLWSRGHNATQAAGQLALALNRIFPAPAWSPLPITTASFDDDMRSRVVLYRARVEEAKPFQTRTVTALAQKRNGELTRLDDRLREAILNDTRTFSRSAPPWLDDALGELGITEDGSVAQSDPRVIEYLGSLGTVPIAGDQTPWCGAFMGWVMKRAGKLDAANYAASLDTLLLAFNWSKFGQPVASGTEQPGDICIIPTPTSHHVALYVGSGPSVLYLLGGNQGETGSGAVTLVGFRSPSQQGQAIFRRPL